MKNKLVKLILLPLALIFLAVSPGCYIGYGINEGASRTLSIDYKRGAQNENNSNINSPSSDFVNPFDRNPFLPEYEESPPPERELLTRPDYRT